MWNYYLLKNYRMRNIIGCEIIIYENIIECKLLFVEIIMHVSYYCENNVDY